MVVLGEDGAPRSAGNDRAQGLRLPTHLPGYDGQRGRPAFDGQQSHPYTSIPREGRLLTHEAPQGPSCKTDTAVGGESVHKRTAYEAACCCLASLDHILTSTSASLCAALLFLWVSCALGPVPPATPALPRSRRVLMR